jgi:hypothetical protein
MCVEPASQTALWLGIASFASSAVGSIASYQAQQQQYQGEMAAYQASQAAYNRQIQLNAEAANRAYVADQMRLKNEYDKAAVDAQKVMATALQTQGKVLASGRVGKSIGLLAQDAERTYGKDMATLGMNLGYANQDYLLRGQETYQQAQTANAAAAANRMIKPSAPSALGLVSGIGGSILGGVQTFNEFAPPGKKIGGR